MLGRKSIFSFEMSGWIKDYYFHICMNDCMSKLFHPPQIYLYTRITCKLFAFLLVSIIRSWNTFGMADWIVLSLIIFVLEPEVIVTLYLILFVLLWRVGNIVEGDVLKTFPNFTSSNRRSQGLLHMTWARG